MQSLKILVQWKYWANQIIFISIFFHKLKTTAVQSDSWPKCLVSGWPRTDGPSVCLVRELMISLNVTAVPFFRSIWRSNYKLGLTECFPERRASDPGCEGLLFSFSAVLTVPSSSGCEIHTQVEGLHVSSFRWREGGREREEGGERGGGGEKEKGGRVYVIKTIKSVKLWRVFWHGVLIGCSIFLVKDQSYPKLFCPWKQTVLIFNHQHSTLYFKEINTIWRILPPNILENVSWENYSSEFFVKNTQLS